MPDLTWMDEALCAQTDPDLFHADGKGASYADARTICGGCPVQPQCGAHAQQFEGDLSYSHRHGMWGNQLPRDRADHAREAAA